jgi:hypothetical protein
MKLTIEVFLMFQIFEVGFFKRIFTIPPNIFGACMHERSKRYSLLGQINKNYQRGCLLPGPIKNSGLIMTLGPCLT